MKKEINLKTIKIDYPLLSKFPAEFLVKNLFFPVKENEHYIDVAMFDPQNLDKISIVENFIQKTVVPYFSEKEEIEKILKKADTFTKVLTDKTESFFLKRVTEEEEDDAITMETVAEEDDSVIKLLNNNSVYSTSLILNGKPANC